MLRAALYSIMEFILAFYISTRFTNLLTNVPRTVLKTACVCLLIYTWDKFLETDTNSKNVNLLRHLMSIPNLLPKVSTICIFIATAQQFPFPHLLSKMQCYHAIIFAKLINENQHFPCILILVFRPQWDGTFFHICVHLCLPACTSFDII